MHIMKYNTRLLLIPIAAFGFGCASTHNGSPPGRTAEDNKIRTIASIGDRPLSSSTGTPESSAVADLDTPRSREDGRDLVSGKVLDDRGDPVSNAKVRVADGGIAGGKVIATKTDRSGAFTLHGLRPGTSYTVVAEFEDRAGFAEGRVEVRSPSTDVEIALGGADEPLDRRRASNSPAARRVSERLPLNDETETPRRPLKLNHEDMPGSASDVEDIDDLAGKTSMKGKIGKETLTVAGWQKSTAAQASSSGTTIANSSTRDTNTKRASTASADDLNLDELPPPSRKRAPRNVDDDPPARGAIDEGDEENPLPPAVHPSRAKGRNPLDDESDDLPPPRSKPAKRVSQTNTKSPGSTPGALVLAKDPNSKRRVQTEEVTEMPPAEEADAIVNPFADPFANSPTSPVRPKTTWGELSSIWKAPARKVKPTVTSEAKEVVVTKIESTELPLVGSNKNEIEACRYDSRKRQIINFRLPDLDGKPVTLKDLDADLILLDFWGTWCRPCLNSIPHIVELQKRLGEGKLLVVGIACEEGPAMSNAKHVREVADQLGINYSILLSSKDQQSPLLEALNIISFPTMIVVDRQGRIIWRDSGATEMTLARLDRAVDPTKRAARSEKVRK